MTSHEHESQQPEQRSSIKVTMNAKHDPQWEVKVVAGSTREELDEIRAIAVEQHNALVQDLIHGRAA